MRQEIARRREFVAAATCFTACQHGDKAAVQAWLDGGRDIDTRLNVEEQEASGVTLLMLAAEVGREPIVEMLLGRKAGPDLQGPEGFTALMLAAENGHLPIVCRLLAAGAAVKLRCARQNDGNPSRTALQIAEYRGDTECARLLRLPWEKIRRALAHWRRHAPLVGRFARHVPEWRAARNEVRYRPGGSGARETQANFERCAKIARREIL